MTMKYTNTVWLSIYLYWRVRVVTICISIWKWPIYRKICNRSFVISKSRSKIHCSDQSHWRRDPFLELGLVVTWRIPVISGGNCWRIWNNISTWPDSWLCVCTLCLPPGLRLSGLTGLISLELNQFPPLLLQSSQSLLSGPQAGLSLGRLSNELLWSRSRLHFPHFLHQSSPAVDHLDLTTSDSAVQFLGTEVLELRPLGDLIHSFDLLSFSNYRRRQFQAFNLGLESSTRLSAVAGLSEITVRINVAVFT